MKTSLRTLSRKLWSRIYKPTRISYVSGSSRLTNALIITDYHDNLSFSVGNELQSVYSTQLINSALVPAECNRFLTGDLLPVSLPRRIHGLSISLLSLWGNNYYHWLFDCLPRWMSIHCSGLIAQTDDPQILMTDLYSSFHAETLQLLGLGGYRKSTLKRIDFVKCDQLIVAPHPNPDFSMLTGDPLEGQGVSRYTVDFLRESFLGFIPVSQIRSRRFYFRREGQARRSIANETDLLHLLLERNFEIIDPASLSFIQQVELANHADWIVAVHGASLANTVFVSPGCHIIELFDPDFQPGIYKSLCHLVDATYHSVILQSQGLQPVDSRQLFLPPCSLDELARILPS